MMDMEWVVFEWNPEKGNRLIGVFHNERQARAVEDSILKMRPRSVVTIQWRERMVTK